MGSGLRPFKVWSVGAILRIGNTMESALQIPQHTAQALAFIS